MFLCKISGRVVCKIFKHYFFYMQKAQLTQLTVSEYSAKLWKWYQYIRNVRSVNLPSFFLSKRWISFHCICFFLRVWNRDRVVSISFSIINLVPRPLELVPRPLELVPRPLELVPRLLLWEGTSLPLLKNVCTDMSVFWAYSVRSLAILASSFLRRKMVKK